MDDARVIFHRKRRDEHRPHLRGQLAIDELEMDLEKPSENMGVRERLRA